MTRIPDDERPIYRVSGPGDDSEGACVGFSGVTRIEAYEEFGEMAPAPWLKVWRKYFLWKRLNASLMEVIEYKDA